ncbi:hypothetical protein N234_36035 [Ralstonia pickettii DTP0602]|nr:hypothetical protein N234_36035 [Ralstonia pickettii DTP0602]
MPLGGNFSHHLADKLKRRFVEYVSQLSMMLGRDFTGCQCLLQLLWR